jgi:ABC-type multidrug transport system fused ATPase/permease subunit
MADRHRNPLWRCCSYYASVPGLFISVTLAAMVVNLAQPFSQWLIGLALHDVESGRAVVRQADGGLDLSRAWWWAGVLIGFTVVRAVAHYATTVFSLTLGQRLLFHLRDQVLTQVQALDLGYHQRHGAGELINRATRDSDKVRDAVVGGYRTILELGMILLGTLALLTWYHPLLALAPAVLLVAAISLAWSHADRLVALDRATDAAYDHVAQDLSEGVHGVRVIKAFALENVRSERFRTRITAYVNAAGEALTYTAVRLPVPQIVVAFGVAWVLMVGAWLVARGLMNVGELIAAVMAMQSLVFRIEGIGRLVQTFADARASAERITELLDAVPTVREGQGTASAGVLRLEAIRVDDPRGGPPILDQLDLELRPGEVVALVGVTGAGKSTLASLLPRLRDPDGGCVRLNGVDVRTLRLAEFRSRIQVVQQDSFLFSDSIAGNLLMAAPQASEAEMWSALDRAAAKDFVAALPQGLAAEVGERGVTLSGGQRQRLCLARALMAKPWVLCGDDATSALDALTERTILAGLRRDLRGTAVLLIASKRSTVQLADRVVLLANGRIAADGTHAELIGDNPAYRELLGLRS